MGHPKIDIQPFVTKAIVRMYDRYVVVTKAEAKKNPMSLADFRNQLIIRGLVGFDKQLAKCEKQLGIT